MQVIRTFPSDDYHIIEPDACLLVAFGMKTDELDPDMLKKSLKAHKDMAPTTPNIGALTKDDIKQLHVVAHIPQPIGSDYDLLFAATVPRGQSNVTVLFSPIDVSLDDLSAFESDYWVSALA